MPDSVSYPAAPGSVREARADVIAQAAAAGVPEDLFPRIMLAVSEAVTNAVLHAYAGAEPGEVHVSTAETAGAFEVVVHDDGHGLVPRPDSPGLGLGLPIVSRVADDLDVSAGEAKGTRVRMRFRFDTSGAAAPDRERRIETGVPHGGMQR
ncbi:MAG TPA: ATP-binding protein [Solirubrobacteraceae bacterium]|nr:ATP-binding protein [Solirubrobacteraceae bacterium]